MVWIKIKEFQLTVVSMLHSASTGFLVFGRKKECISLNFCFYDVYRTRDRQPCKEQTCGKFPLSQEKKSHYVGPLIVLLRVQSKAEPQDHDAPLLMERDVKPKWEGFKKWLFSYMREVTMIRAFFKSKVCLIFSIRHYQILPLQCLERLLLLQIFLLQGIVLALSGVLRLGGLVRRLLCLVFRLGGPVGLLAFRLLRL